MGTRRTIPQSVYIGATCLALTTGCKSSDSNAVSVDSVRQHLGSAADIKVDGMGHYCSILESDGLTWDFKYLGSDPCGEATDSTIKRAGLYSVEGENHIIVRCASDTQYYDYGLNGMSGTTILNYARQQAQGKEGCIFMVAPKALPIFDSPFSLNPYPTGFAPGNGTDFNRPEFIVTYPTNCSGYLFGTQMNDRGQDRTCGSGSGSNDHFGNDWVMDRGSPLYAVAPGIVVKSREFTTLCCGSDSPVQGEVYIEHRVVRNGWENEPHSERYVERFISAYYHVERRMVVDGQVITNPINLVIASSGHNGCSTAPHLHWGPSRLTNTSRAHVESLIFSPGPGGASSNVGEYGIDAYGWNGPFADPVALWGLDYGYGALSINLWKDGQAPSRGNW